MTLDTERSAIADAVAVARGLGLVVNDPVALKASLNLIVWLRPSPHVARVALRTSLVRDPNVLADSLALAAFLAAAGAPVVGPATDVDPGPHRGPGGWVMTLWPQLAIRAEAADPHAAGHALRDVHEAAAGYDGPLRHVGPLAEVERLAGRIAGTRPRDANRLRDFAARIVLPDLPHQALHGDAHLGNVVATPDGVRWLDWEESWRGPRAWDLAALDHRRRFGELEAEIGAAMDGYGVSGEQRDAIEAWAPVIALWAAAWGLLGWSSQGVVGRNTRRRLEWLRLRLGD